MGSSNANALFSRPGDFTVFVPTNDAFAKIPDDKMNEMLNEPGQLNLKALLSYHIVPGRIMAANIGGQQVRKSISGDEIDFADYQGIKVNGSPLQGRNIEATDGVVHSLGVVLAPPPQAGEKRLAWAAHANSNPLPPNSKDSTTVREEKSAATTAEFPSIMPAAIPQAARAASPAKRIF